MYLHNIKIDFCCSSSLNVYILKNFQKKKKKEKFTLIPKIRYTTYVYWKIYRVFKKKQFYNDMKSGIREYIIDFVCIFNQIKLFFYQK